MARPHALVIPCPTLSHIMPMMAFSEKLSSNGILVTFVNTQHSHCVMNMDSLLGAYDPLSFRPGSDSVRFAQISDGLPLDFDRSAHFEQYLLSIDKMGGALEDLICKLNEAGDHPPTCIIADSFLPWTFDVARKFDLTWVFFWTQSITVCAMYYHLSDIISHGHFPPKKTDPLEVIDYIPGLPALKAEDLTSFIQKGDASEFLVQLIFRQFELVHQADWIIGNTLDEVESQASEAMQITKAPICSVGPLLRLDGIRLTRAAAESCNKNRATLEWVDSQPTASVLYVSFGTVVRLSAAQIEEIARGLLESGQLFVWVLRPENIATSTSGVFDILPRGFWEETRDRGLVIPWSPQLLLLSHPSVGGFFTHCGWNSTIESLSFGVPLITFPQWSDQYTNRMLIVDQWKIGLKLNCREDGMVPSGEIAKAVKALMQGEDGMEMRNRALELKERSREAVSEGGSSMKNLQSFVDAIVLGKRREVRSHAI